MDNNSLVGVLVFALVGGFIGSFLGIHVLAWLMRDNEDADN